MAGVTERVDVGLSHRHDLGLHADLHPVEGQRRRARELYVEGVEAGKAADAGEDRIDGGIGAGDRPVDPLMREEQRAAGADVTAQPFKITAHGIGVGQVREFVERRYADRRIVRGHAATS